MASCAESPQDFIRSVFGPRVAVISSPDAEEVCQKNNLSFVEMLKPFCRPTQEGQIRDPQNQLHIIKNMVLHISEPQPNPLPSNICKKILSDTVRRCHVPGDQGTTITAGDIRVNTTTPWFEAYRSVFFEHSRQSDHEFLQHYVACILVVSSSHSNPMEEFANLYQRHTETKVKSKHPKYMPHPRLFYYRLLLHDVTYGDEQKAQKLQQEMSVKYGIGQSLVLKINSRNISSLQDSEQAPDADPWSQYLITTDTSQEEDGFTMSDEDEEPDLSTTYSSPPFRPAASDAKQSQNLTPVSSEPRLDLLIGDPLASESISDPLSSDPLSETSDPLTRALQDSELGTGTEIASSRDSNQLDSTHFRVATRQISAKGFHGQCLTLNDQEKIRAFVNDFTNRGLLPFLENHIRLLNEQVNSKKGFQRALYRVGRSWFGGSKPSSNQTGVTNYSVESGELQMRLLGDLAFLSQNYDLAYGCYHSCKRDFQNDHAWLHYAGALEMAATSLFMQTVNRRDPYAYFEESIQVYADTCKLLHYANRATLLATEMMKARKLYRPAAAAFIKMTSEDSDLKSALFLEQAAHCFLRMSPPFTRKFAFHLILAGHRYSKAFQRRHALRTYGQALEFYQEKSWSLAEDHINFSLGHQSFTLKQLEDAYVAFRRLLSPSWSLQQPKQQNTYLKEFLYVFKQHLISIGLGSTSATAEVSDGPVPFLSSVEATKDLPILPLPVILSQQTRVLVSCVAGYDKQLLPDDNADDGHGTVGTEGQSPGTGCSTRVGFSSFESLDADCSLSMDGWRQLEQHAVNGHGSSDPTVEFVSCLQNHYHQNTENSTEPVCVVGERVDVELMVHNPLQIELCLGKLSLLWEHNSPDGQRSDSVAVVTKVLDEFAIAPGSKEQLRLSLTPLCVGTVNIVGIAYNLKAKSIDQDSDEQDESDVRLLQRRDRKSSVKRMLNVGVRGKQLVHCRGPRLNRDAKEKSSIVYGNDKRLHLRVTPAMPQLEVAFINFPSSMLCGEVKLVNVKFTNSGKTSLKNLKISSFYSHCFTFGLFVKDSNISMKTSAEVSKDGLPPTEGGHSRQPLALHVPAVISIQLPHNELESGDSIAVPMWVHGGNEPGVQEINLLFSYEPVELGGFWRHRILRHTAHISLASSVRLTASAELSSKNALNGSRGDNVMQELLLTLDIENISHASREKTTSFELRQVSCISWQWQIYAIASQKTLEYILPKESRMLKFGALYGSRNLMTKSLHSSQICLSEQLKEIDSYSSPCIDFFLHSATAAAMGLSVSGKDFVSYLEDEMDGFAKSKHVAATPSQESAALKGSHAVLNQKLAADEALGLILLWKGTLVDGEETHHVFGQSHAAVCLQAFEELNELGNLVTDNLLMRASLNHLPSFNHNFDDKRICQLPVHITLQNTSRDMVELDIHLLPPCSSPSLHESVEALSSSPAASVHHHRHRLFSWVGSTRRHITVAAFSTCCLKASVCLTGPGLYKLSQLKLRARRVGKDSDFVLQTCIPESVVIVTGASRDHLASSTV